MAALKASSASTEQWILTGGRLSSATIWVCLIDRHALHPLGGQRRRRERRPAPERLELGVLDDAGGIDLQLQLHHVAAGRRADQDGADERIVLVDGPDDARVLV